MGTLTKTLILVAIIVCAAQALAATEGALPPNVFEKDPTGRGWVWWRPKRVVFDAERVAAIQAQAKAVSDDAAPTVSLEKAFGENLSSAFLFPVLSAHGEKGAVLLERLLAQYQGARPLDDRWLLAVASLGRIPSPTAQGILEKELERVCKKDDYFKPLLVKGRPIPRLDARIALMDALLACQAMQGTLTAVKVDALDRSVQDVKWYIWASAFEWARAYMPQAAVVNMVREGLETCSEADLRTGTNFELSSDRLRDIRNFLLGPSDIWPITRTLALEEARRGKSAVSDYLLAVVYSTVLVSEADQANGKYPIDAETVKAFTSANLKPSRALSFNCWILLKCQPSAEIPEWQEFLAKHAATIDPRDLDMAQSFLGRIRGKKTEATPYERRGYERITEPGVHLFGFKAVPTEVRPR